MSLTATFIADAVVDIGTPNDVVDAVVAIDAAVVVVLTMLLGVLVVAGSKALSSSTTKPLD